MNVSYIETLLFVMLNKILRDTVNLNLDTSLAMEKECFFSNEHRACIDKFLHASRRRDRAEVTEDRLF